MNKQIIILLAGREKIIEQLIKVLAKNKRFYLKATAASGPEAIKKIKEQDEGVDLFLLDFALPQISGVKVAEYINLTIKKPSIIVSDQANPDFMRAAMLAGAREFLVLPLGGEELEFALTRVYELEQERQVKSTATASGINLKKGNIIAFVSGKGGTGTSTISVLTALALAKNNLAKKYLLLEIKEGLSDLSVLLDIKSQKTFADLLPVADEIEKLQWQAAVNKITANLDFIAAGPQLSQQVDNIPTLFEYFLKHYNLVLVDLSYKFIPSLISLTDYFIIVTTTEVVSVRLCGQLLSELRQNGLSSQSLLLLINQCNLQFLTAQQISDYLQLNVAWQIPQLPLVAELTNEGRLASCQNILPQVFQSLASKLEEELTVV